MSQNVETIYRVHVSGEGVFLEIGDYPEAPEVLQIRTVREEDKEWFGEMRLTLSPEFAIDLGNALATAGYAKQAALKAGKC